MRDKLREQIRGVVTQPHGMFIVCGPTGAGKSTTLYACLSEIDRYQRNVITVENPVEYNVSNVTQIEINIKAGKTFASELRSILRQDPDVIMIGEIRDQETAEIACQAAQTGHMVFTTLHANDTVTALGRLIDLGVQPFMIASALSSGVASNGAGSLPRRLRPSPASPSGSPPSRSGWAFPPGPPRRARGVQWTRWSCPSPRRGARSAPRETWPGAPAGRPRRAAPPGARPRSPGARGAGAPASGGSRRRAECAVRPR